MPKVSRKDYRAPEYQIPQTYLNIEHYDEGTLVKSKLHVVRVQGADKSIPLSLKKEKLEIITIHINGLPPSPGQVTIKDDEVLFHNLPDNCEITVHQRIQKPSENTEGAGMYESNGDIYSQFEAESDRRLYLSPSRPDMPTQFTIRIAADKNKYPTLLANPHLIKSGTVENNESRHFAEFNCPSVISTYLACIIMGNLDYREVNTKKPNGQDVNIRAYAPKGYAQFTEEALKVPEAFWRWQHQTYNLVYSLNQYNMVFIPDYQSGAMENEGLNTYNAVCLLPKSISTDAGYFWAVGTIAHEQTHHVFGNRVPIEHWLDLALKEGLTSAMGQEFERYYSGSDCARITNIDYLISKQYPEDAGKLSHPVRNDSYEDVNNCYTTTTYYKGAEIWHMLHSMLGNDVWRQGISTYVERYTNKPASIQTLINVMQEVSGKDLTQFTRWFDQAGTPQVSIEDSYDAATQTYRLKLKQSCPAREGKPENLPFHIPVKMGLLDANGNEMPVDASGNTETILDFTQPEQEFVFKCAQKPVPSLFRDFSAPIKIQSSTLSTQDHCHILAHDKDNISRWVSGQYLMKQSIKLLLSRVGGMLVALLDSLREVFTNPNIPKDVRAALIKVPNMDTLMSEFVGSDPLKILNARKTLQGAIALHLKDKLLEEYKSSYKVEAYEFTPGKAANRSLYNTALEYLCFYGDREFLALAHSEYTNADALNDKDAALSALFSSYSVGEANQYLASFLSQYPEGLERDLATEHWIKYMALNERDISFASLKQMTASPVFIWERPNHVRELFRAIVKNIELFHHDSGAGYQYFAEVVLKIDKTNPDLASTAARQLVNHDKLDPVHASLMLDALRKIARTENISEELTVIVNKGLPANEQVVKAAPAASSSTASTEAAVLTTQSRKRNSTEAEIDNDNDLSINNLAVTSTASTFTPF